MQNSNENPKARSPHSIFLGTSLSDAFSKDFIEAGRTLEKYQFSVFKNPEFWERYICTLLGGEHTPRRCEHDVDINIWGRPCTVEIKFSNEYFQKYTPIRGKDWSRYVFKWAKVIGNSGKKNIDVVVLIGLSKDNYIYCWALPRNEIKSRESITVASPDERTSVSGYDKFMCPLDALLPQVAYICHKGKL